MNDATVPVIDAEGIKPWYWAVAAAAFAAMFYAIWLENRWLLNFVHVISGILWTGMDLLMGFIVGPALRAAPFEARRAVSLRISARTIVMLPTLAIITGTSGWYHAKMLGFLDVSWPAYGWVAAALFGGHRLRWQRIRELLAAPAPRGITPSFHFACDFLTEEVAAVFDRLYHGALSRAERPVYRYLALRWVQGFAQEDDFPPLLTHDPAQLHADIEHDWAPYLRRARQAPMVLKKLARDINTAIGLVRTDRVQLRGEDMLTLVGRLDYGAAPFIVANPPTRGLDEYVIDDQLIHSLLANRWLDRKSTRLNSSHT